MKNIWTIFISDLKRLRRNPIALLVLFGIVIVPSFYAWFNTAASWNPYSKTSTLKVAVSSMDEGYTGEFIPMELHLGDDIISKLHENDQLNWIFTSDEDALEGVRSGKYYAAFVIPKDFSRRLMSVFSSDAEHPEIFYYRNEKGNAIAPKITDKGADGLQKQINETFLQTLTESTFTALHTVVNSMDKENSIEFLDALIEHLESVSRSMDAANDTVQAFANLTDATVQMFTATNQYLSQSQSVLQYSKDTLDEYSVPITDLHSSIERASDSVNTALSDSESYYEQISKELRTLLSDAPAVTDNLAGKLESISSDMEPVISADQHIISAFSEIPTEDAEASMVKGMILSKLNEALNSQLNLQEKLKNTASQMRSSTAEIESAKEELHTLVSDSIQDISSVKSTYDKELKEKFDSLYHSLDVTKSSVRTLLSQMDTGTDQLETLTEHASSDLLQAQNILHQTSASLTSATDEINHIISHMKQAADEKDDSVLSKLLSSKEKVLSDFLSSPVQLQTHQIYPIENYGSSMAPFYTALSIWVGGIVLVAMLNTNVSDKCKKGLKNLHSWQEYFGRFLLFAILGLLQTLLICLGDLYFLGIQCTNPVLFVFSGLVSSIVYVQIIYTLTLSFGDIGKATCIVLLVVQVAGSGGTFPIETAPEFFRLCYPFFPFSHTMTAMRECIGGFYGQVYWQELLKLGYFSAGALILGIVLRVPMIKFNKFFTEKLESTHLM